MKVVNISNVLDLTKHLILGDSKDLTKPILDKFITEKYDYIIVKNFMLNSEFLFFETERAMNVNFDFILSKKSNNKNVKYSLTLTELKQVINKKTTSNISKEVIYLYDDIIDAVRNVLNEIHYDDDGVVTAYFKDKTIAIDLDFCVEIRAQDSSSCFDKNNRLFIEKVLFSC